MWLTVAYTAWHTIHLTRPTLNTQLYFNTVFVLTSCRPLPTVQQAQREARQATFLFRRGLKVHNVMCGIELSNVLRLWMNLNVSLNFYWHMYNLFCKGFLRLTGKFIIMILKFKCDYISLLFMSIALYRYRPRCKSQILALLQSELDSEYS